jgi:hypothetical protein
MRRFQRIKNVQSVMYAANKHEIEATKQLLLIRLAHDPSFGLRPRRPSNILYHESTNSLSHPKTVRTLLDLEAPDDGGANAGGAGGVICFRQGCCHPLTQLRGSGRFQALFTASSASRSSLAGAFCLNQASSFSYPPLRLANQGHRRSRWVAREPAYDTRPAAARVARDILILSATMSFIFQRHREQRPGRSGSLGEPRGERRVRERHVHATWAADDFDRCIEVLRERLDEGCTQAAPRRGGGDIRLSDPIVGHDKLPVRSFDLVADDNPTVLSVFGKSVFQSIDHELGDDKAEADGLGGLGRAAVDQNLQRDRPTVTDHRGRKAFA